MRKNEDLQKDVQDALKWEPLLKAAEIGVIVKDGIVTLIGTVDSYAKKIEAENAAKFVTGVKAVVEKIDVKFENIGLKTNDEIAAEIVSAFKWNWEVPSNKIKVTVEDNWVTLEGEVQWNFQKEAAKKSVKNILGVKGINNYITIKSDTHDEIEKLDIERAIKRNWAIDDKNITVHVTGQKVTLSGTVESLYQKDEAGRIAWNAPGVLIVENDLSIENDAIFF